MTKVLVVGGGRVGSLIAGVLSIGGASVTMVVRNKKRRECIESGGLTVFYRDGRVLRVNPKLVESLVFADDIYNLVLLAVRNPDMTELLEQLASKARKFEASRSVVVNLMNGVDADAAMSRQLPEVKSVAGAVNIGAELEGEAGVRETAGRSIELAPVRNISVEEVCEVAKRLASHGIPARTERSHKLIRWRKLVWNAPINAVTTLTNRNVSSAAACPSTQQLIRDAMREFVAVAQAESIDLDSKLVEILVQMAIRSGGLRSSMQLDVAAGRVTEHQALNGAVVRYGERNGTSTPVNAILVALLDGKLRVSQPSRELLDAETLRKYIGDNLGLDLTNMDDDTSLFASGLLDSFSLIDLLEFVQTKTGLDVPPSHVTLDHFDSVSRIVSFASASENR